MNDYIIKILMQQRQEQILAEHGAARITQLKWQRIICRIHHKLSSIFSRLKKSLLKAKYPGVNKGGCQ